jgi:hypothetical protein
MGVAYNCGSIVTSGLVLALDAANPRNFNLTAVEVLVVAGGGGGGGGDVGSGGGAGGLIYNSNFAVTPGTQLTVTIGDGGAGSPTYNIDGSNGSPSVFGSLEAIGGGGGASWGSGTGQDGGSGGGGVGGSAGGLGTAGQGFAGGTGLSGPDYPQGGGGGAGGVGQTPTIQTKAGDGGIGLYFSQFASVGGYPAGWFAGGGGGGQEAGTSGSNAIPGNGGLGGGGNGGRQVDAIIATAGSPNTGGGGGGTDPGTGGAGGSGIIIVRYPGPQKAIGGTVTSVGGDTIHTFTTSGNFTPQGPTNGSAVLGLSDLSGNGNFGTSVNGPTYSSANGGSLVFDGTDDYITIPFNASTMDFSLAQTICMWIKPTTGSNTARRNPYNQAYGGPGTLTYETDGTISYYFGTNGGNSSPYVGRGSGFTIAANETAFISVTRNQVTNVCNWYKNGVLITTSDAGGYATTANGTSPIWIGDGYVNGFLGNIYDCKVYNRALTASEIQQNYNALKSRYL